jgi:hypothetical protein
MVARLGEFDTLKEALDHVQANLVALVEKHR